MLILMSVLFAVAMIIVVTLCILLFKITGTNDQLKSENKGLKETLATYLPDKVENLTREKE